MKEAGICFFLSCLASGFSLHGMLQKWLRNIHLLLASVVRYFFTPPLHHSVIFIVPGCAYSRAAGVLCQHLSDIPSALIKEMI